MFSTVNLKKLAILGLVIICICFSTPSFAQDGSPDNSFGTSGAVITNVAGTGDMAYSVAIQTDKKIVLGGFTTIASAQYFALTRYWPDGTVDSSFGINGRAIAGFDTLTFAYLTAIKLQQDGKIVAAGYAGNSNFALLRFNTDGTVDSTYGVNGRVVTNFAGQTVTGNALAIQPDGYIVVAGNVGCDIGLCRYKTDGTLDAAFGVNGIKLIDFGACEKANAVILLPGGKILVGGSTQTGAIGQFLLLRCKANGQIDASFGTGGKTTLLPRQTYNAIYSLALQANGKIVAAGLAKYFSSAYGVARFSSNGAPDSSFGTNGILVHQFTNTSEEARAVALQADGKILVAGNINDGGALQAAMVRLTSGGTVDSTFGIYGEVRTGLGNGTFGYSLVIQGDAKIVVGGYSYFAARGNDFSVLRYNAPSVLPIKLSSFTATAVKRVVALNWATASENNNSYFSIERSGNNSGFAYIGKVYSNGNSSQLKYYSFTDLQPLQEDNFYRLKQVDLDGRFTYSNTVRVSFSTSPYIVAYPNPTKNTVKISGLGNAAYISVINAGGKILIQSTSAGNDYALNIRSLAPGIYFIRVKQGEKITNLKIVKE